MDQDKFDFIPLSVDPKNNAVSSASQPASRALETELAYLNMLTFTLGQLEGPLASHPNPVNPKRSAAVTRFRDAGNAEFRKGKYDDAGKAYTMGLQVALSRPPWERSQLVREEVSALFANRAQTCMALRRWPEGAVDAESSVEAKRVGNTKAWWRRGKCLMEMGRLQEAKEWVGRALELEGEEGELVALLKEIDEKVEKSKVES
ncbi:hypothetical protein jhhlp_002816 [Lomentospora prolificans]|uniref:Uncharacterized protein n=1 Tax=Lomentospora prolificans TaxID=41688 RepID=A0A2N3NF52_9PEZI|nr:hypothetical protein jhhlp_002816 [Lomentospora prolificans]